MSNLKTSKLAIVAVAAGAVILLATETTQAGGFSVRIGGVGFGSWNTCRVQRSYIYIGDCDDWGYTRVYREYYRPRPRYRVSPYYGSRRFHTMPYPRRRHHRH